ncbi:MAG: transporter [Verrucomicrobia bacterium]|nr:transporter [Verrucomicrobiota bacterium]
MLLRHAWVGLAAWLPVSLPAQVTESPRTVAPGRVLVRIDGLKLTFDRADAAGNTYDAIGVASTTLRAGLTEMVDLQVGLDFFVKETVRFRGARDSDSGLGDVSFRTKWTFWRDDKSGAAAAVMPYVRFPTGSSAVGSKAVEGGVIVPWAMDAGAGFRAGAMFQWDVVRNDADNGYDAHWFVSGFAVRDLSQAFAVYGETTAEIPSTGFSNSAATMGAGVLWRFSKNLVFDYELQRGLGDRAPAWTHIWRANWEW